MNAESYPQHAVRVHKYKGEFGQQTFKRVFFLAFKQQLSKYQKAQRGIIQGDADSSHTCFNVRGPSKVKQARRNQPQLLEKSKYSLEFNF